MKSRIILFVIISILLLNACGTKPQPPTIRTDITSTLTETLTPTLIPSETVAPNSIYVKGNEVEIRACPFFNCEIVYLASSGSYIEAIAYDGQIRDPYKQFWLQVKYDGDNLGWLYGNPKNVVIPDGLFKRLSLAAWNTPTVTPIPAGDLLYALKHLCGSNINDPRNPRKGKSVRFETPIMINPNGVKEIITATENFEKATGGLVTFEIVNQDPLVGIIVDTGDGVGADGKPSCGNVTNGRNPRSGHDFLSGIDGVMKSQIFIHLGSAKCKYNQSEPPIMSRFAITEHELAHAIGIGNHFDGFTGNEGLSYNVILVLKALYGMPPGSDMTQSCSGK